MPRSKLCPQDNLVPCRILVRVFLLLQQYGAAIACVAVCAAARMYHHTANLSHVDAQSGVTVAVGTAPAYAVSAVQMLRWYVICTMASQKKSRDAG